MNSKNVPILSVLMPVYNSEKYLKQSIDSILNQTYKDFEFIIINDGSSDNSVNIIKSYKDKRIIFLQNEVNLGIVQALNYGLLNVRGKFIARMDSDDISLPTRFEKQLEYFEKNPEIVLLGTAAEIYNELGTPTGDIWKYETDSERIKISLLFNSVFIHPSIMIKKTAMINYNEEFKYAEDYNLWVRITEKNKCANIDDILLKYRVYKESSSRVKSNECQQKANNVRVNLLKNMGLVPSYSEIDLHKSISLWLIPDKHKFINKTDIWFKKIINTNKITKYFNQKILIKILSERFENILGRYEISTFKKYFYILFSKTFSFTIKLNYFSVEIYQKYILKNLKTIIKDFINYKKSNPPQ